MPSCLPHQATAEPAWLPSDPQGDASRDTMGTEGVLVGVRLVWQASWPVHTRRRNTMATIQDRGERHMAHKGRGIFWCTSISTPSTTRNSMS